MPRLRAAIVLALSSVCASMLLVGAPGCGGEDAPAEVTERDAGPAPLPPPPPPLPPPPEDAAPPPPAVPASLVERLGGKTYVEGECTETTFDGWPHEAQRCTYRNGLVVTIANPPPERVARWIVDASRLIPALAALEQEAPDRWEEGLGIIASHTMGQSSRIFPLAGQVYENGTAYVFERGVTKTCSSGCYCRINSTSRTQWCRYADEVLGLGDAQACLVTMGQTTSKLTEPWLAHCFANHVASWSSDANPHFRAMAWNANRAIVAALADAGASSADAVLAALRAQYPR